MVTRICGCDEMVVLSLSERQGYVDFESNPTSEINYYQMLRTRPSIFSHSHTHAPPDTCRRECAVTTTYLGDRRHKYVTNDHVENHEDAENRRMVKNEGEHTLASGRRGSARCNETRRVESEPRVTNARGGGGFVTTE
jgi:hypothetical protein